MKEYTYVYSKKAEEKIKETLQFAEKHSRVQIHEWRNFIDYDLIPLIKYFVKKEESSHKNKLNGKENE